MFKDMSKVQMSTKLAHSFSFTTGLNKTPLYVIKSSILAQYILEVQTLVNPTAQGWNYSPSDVNRSKVKSMNTRMRAQRTALNTSLKCFKVG